MDLNLWCVSMVGVGGGGDTLFLGGGRLAARSEVGRDLVCFRMLVGWR